MCLSSLIYKNMVKALGRIIERGNLPEHCDSEPLSTDVNARLSFIAWGDPQISFISPLRSARVYAACRDVLCAKGVYDALVMLGDITEYGAFCEYKMAAKLVNGIKDKTKRVYAVSGNHDIRLRRYKKQLCRFNEFLSMLDKGVIGNSSSYYFSDEINGYKFIMLGADCTSFEASYISERQLEWLKDELDSVPQDMPVFVFNHQALKNTNGLPETWLGKGNWRGTVGRQSDKLRSVLETHENVIFVTGHLHYGISEYTYEDLGKIKAVSVPTVGVLNHGTFSANSQGIIFSVYEDRIKCCARLFAEGKYVDDGVKNHSFTILLKKK